MPQIAVTTSKGWIADRARLLADLRDAAVAALDSRPAAFSLWVNEHDADGFLRPADRGANFTIIEMRMFTGRSDAMKGALTAALRRAAEAHGLAPADLDILLIEVPPAGWSLGGR